MLYHHDKTTFYFEKDERFLNHLLTVVPNGVIKRYPHCYVLEPLPEILIQGHYDFVIIDGKQIPWSELFHFTKDRVKMLVSGKDSENRKLVTIENFYSRRYDEKSIATIFETYEDSQLVYSTTSFSMQVMNFEFINMVI